MEPFAPKVVRDAYDTVADDYAEAFASDLERLPVDRAVLDAMVGRVAGRAPVVDVGCGPGQVTEYLAARAVQVIGADLSPGMLRVARRGTARLNVVCADMRSLPVRSRSCLGAVAFYSIQHVPRGDIGKVFGEFRRVLTVDGVLLVATHLGEGEIYTGDFLGHTIQPVGGTFYRDAELEEALVSQSFVVEDARHRDPLPHEHQSRRVYLTARLTEG